MKLRLLYLLSILLFAPLFLSGQPKCFFEHYGAEDGLPQHTVMSILQDRKGFMWFSTWNGLSKFDGYNFTTYKIQQGDAYHMRSNRIDHINEDKYGYIWTLPYDNEPHRFDPRTERFMGLRSVKGYENITFMATKVVPTASGKVWLQSNDMGCVAVLDSTFNVELFDTANKKLQSNNVIKIFEDKNLITWILTDKGLHSLSADNKDINVYFADQSAVASFYSAAQIGNEIWFGSTNGKIWRFNSKNGTFLPLETNINSHISDIKEIDSNRILLITQNDGFCIYNKSSNRLDKYNIANAPSMRSNKILSNYIDKFGNIWFEMDLQGVAKFDLKTENIKHFEMKIESSISNVFPPNFFIFEDNSNHLYIHLRGGGFGYYDPQTEQLVPFYNEPSSPLWRFSNLMHAGFSDRQGNLWLSTRSHGLEKIIFSNTVFKASIIDPNVHSTINNDVRSIFEDSKQRLWVATKDGKIIIYENGLNPIGYLCKDGRIGSGEPITGTSYTIIEDNKKNIWLGTKGDGVYILSPTENSRAYKVEHYKSNPNDRYSLSDNSIYSIHQDNKHRIWIGTYGGGLNLADPQQKGRFVSYKNELKDYPMQNGSKIRIISSDKHGNICIGTTLGLIMFSSTFDQSNAIKYKIYTRIPEDITSIQNNDIYDICTTQKGETYLATFGGGINKIAETDAQGFPKAFVTYTTNDGLASDVTLSIVEDKEQNLWIASEGNLTRFDTKKNTFETYSEVSRLIKGQNFSEGSRYTTRSGIVYFGYSKGLISINPEKIEKNDFIPYVALTKLLVSNKLIEVGPDSPLDENIDDIKQLKLSHKQNFFSLEFAALDYVDPKRISYAYKLDGLDEDWIITKDQRIANYSNLAPGKYTFHVKSTNSDGTWMNNERTLEIEIVPSFWQTNWAMLLYAIIFIAILYSILRTIFIFYRLKDKVNMEHQQIEMKSRFFTDISHEIRTPLTMIVSPIENMMEDERTPEENKSQLQLMLKNANRMLRMVNQILDFRKIQKQNLTIQETAFGAYVSDICHNFSKTAEVQGIDLKVSDRTGNEKLWIDRDSIEKLVFNLLSNAFKYTPIGKSIEINIFKKDKNIVLQVVDEGRGMTKDILHKLFTRFASFNEDKSKPSTGIGLSIVKEVADKHHAKIQVDSGIDEGSCFTLIFPTGIEHFDKNTNILTQNEPEETSNSDILLNDTETNTPATDTEKPIILIVEDDADLRHFVGTILSPYYEVQEAENGKEGYKLATEIIPDFIVSDLMMPEMDGVELLKQIRANAETSHIPFILLTAKTDIESKISSLEHGADDYLTKPFSVKYLRARIDNIFRQRKHLFETFALNNNVQLQPVRENENKQEDIQPITEQDAVFLKKVSEIVENNIDNSNFLIEDLVAEMAMSRTVFFKKLKSLTGSSPIEFVRDIKIRHAAGLIASDQYTIKEVSFMIGIADTKYFTQCFKRIYEMTPSEYRNQVRESKQKK